MDDLPLLLAAGLIAGAAAGQLDAPLASDWRARKGAMKRRLLDLSRPAPKGSSRLIGAAILAATLISGALAAYAAEPSAPERLAAEAAGVVGSGDQLSLKIREAQGERTVKIGEDYADGWKLDALTPTSATLVKDGQRRDVGLNPTGALAANPPAAPPSLVQVTRSDDDLLAMSIKSGIWDGKTPLPGLTLEQSRRYALLYARGMEGVKAYADDINAKSVAAGIGGIRFSDDGRLLISALGAEGAEFVTLRNTQTLSKRDLGAALFERLGPVEVVVPRPAPGPAANQADYREAIRQRDAQYPGASWTTLPSVAGDNTYTYVMRAPDPNPSLLSTDILPLDQLAFFGSGAPPGGPGMMTAAQWLAQAPGARKP